MLFVFLQFGNLVKMGVAQPATLVPSKMVVVARLIVRLFLPETRKLKIRC
jgi:hypothetical protein